MGRAYNVLSKTVQNAHRPITVQNVQLTMSWIAIHVYCVRWAIVVIAVVIMFALVVILIILCMQGSAICVPLLRTVCYVRGTNYASSVSLAIVWSPRTIAVWNVAITIASNVILKTTVPNAYRPILPTMVPAYSAPSLTA